MKINKEKIEKIIDILVVNIIRLIVIGIYINGIITNNHSNDAILILTFIFSFYPTILLKVDGMKVPIYLKHIFIFFVFGAQVLGEICDFYEKISWWDIMLHLISGIVFGLSGFLFVYRFNDEGKSKVNLKPVFVITTAFSYALVMGIVWEVFEFIADRGLGFNMQKFRLPGQDGLFDTMSDILISSLGTLISCVGAWLYMRKYKDDTLMTGYFDKWFIRKEKNDDIKLNKD